jgi:hypothetical protein
MKNNPFSALKRKTPDLDETSAGTEEHAQPAKDAEVQNDDGFEPSASFTLNYFLSYNYFSKRRQTKGKEEKEEITAAGELYTV